jgi:hypothetical protein
MCRVLSILIIGALLSAATAAAQSIRTVQGSDGTSGTIIDLGGGIHRYSDSHGNTGILVDLGGGLQGYQFSSPPGRFLSGSVLTLPAPRRLFTMPPAGLTTAPVLPFAPKGPLIPLQPRAPITPFRSGPHYGTTGADSMGRVGR